MPESSTYRWSSIRGSLRYVLRKVTVHADQVASPESLEDFAMVAFAVRETDQDDRDTWEREYEVGRELVRRQYGPGTRAER